MFDDDGNPWFVGEPPRLIQFQQDWKETQKKPDTNKEEDDLISLFAGNELIFFHAIQDLHQAKSWFLMR